MTRLTAESWSVESRIWKPCGSAASFQCARRKRLHRPWKVPTHMPRTGIASIASRRVSISLAALLVKVTASTPPGESWPVWISQAMRVVSTRVLPEPAPARISAGSGGRVTAASCSGFRPSSRREGGRGSGTGIGLLSDPGALPRKVTGPRPRGVAPSGNLGQGRADGRGVGPVPGACLYSARRSVTLCQLSP